MRRSWVSEPGGLYVTFHLCPLDAATVPLHAVAGALSVADAVRETSGLTVDLKWPNDVLHDGRKLAGILAESTLGARIDVFLGIGINLRPVHLPAEVADLATNIKDAGGRVPTREELLAALSAALEVRAAQLARSADTTLIDDWRRRLTTLGRRIRLVAVGGQEWAGEAVDVSQTGELILQLDDGARTPFAAGDVTTLP
jgi:BirA family biotin operon repressor/biotin-[acetyl-CoA-carboxylase] ligase